VVHAVLGAAAVASATHWVVWLWPLWRGRATRASGMRRFAIIALSLYGAAMAVGLLLYPTYKVRVKLEYLTRPSSVIEDAATRGLAHDELIARSHQVSPPVPDVDRARRAAGDAPLRASKVARWFDSKEHWVALGLVLGLGVLAVVTAWRPGVEEPVRDGPVAFVVLGALAVAAVLWFAAIVGLITTATRSF
jgi:hypothetical protein